MTADGGDANKWVRGTFADLQAMIQSQTDSGGTSEQLTAIMWTAVPVWAAEPVRFAQHLCLLADLYCGSYEAKRDPVDLDRALDAWRHVPHDAAGIPGFVTVRMRLLAAGLNIAVAERDNPGGLPAVISENCEQFKKELQYARNPALLDAVARHAGRWAKFAIERDEWAAAADSLDLAATAANLLVYTVPAAERALAVNKFRWLTLDAVSALARSGRLNEAVVRLEASRQRILRAARGRSDLDRLLKATNPALHAQHAELWARWIAAARDHFSRTDPAAISAARAKADEASRQLHEVLAQVRQIPGLAYFQLKPDLEEIRRAAQPDPILYIWTSQFDTGLALMLPDGRLKGRLLSGFGNKTVGDILRRWTDSLEPRAVGWRTGAHHGWRAMVQRRHRGAVAAHILWVDGPGRVADVRRPAIHYADRRNHHPQARALIRLLYRLFTDSAAAL